jgi:bifunctional non-homologous end joining protein LigD
MNKSQKLKSDPCARNAQAELKSQVQRILLVLQKDGSDLQIEMGDYQISLTNLNKVFWPGHGKQLAITKRDYIAYLVRVAPYLLPHLRDRLLTMLRFPHGIDGERFYQKHWEDHLPRFVETVIAYTEHEHKDQEFLLCNNLSTLIWLGQIANLELHTAHSRVCAAPDAFSLPLTFTGSLNVLESSLLNYPDFLVFDLDPYLYSGREEKGEEPELHRKGFRKTRDLALWLKELLDSLLLKAFIKTSGRTGLHIYVPIVRNVDYDMVRHFSEEIGRAITMSHEDDVTMEWSVAKRSGKVFLDHNMNARSKSLASVYSARIAGGAPVSTPLAWEELEKTYPTDYRIDSVSDRLEQVGDLWSEIISHKNDLAHLFGVSKVNVEAPPVSTKRMAGSLKRSVSRGKSKTRPR